MVKKLASKKKPGPAEGSKKAKTLVVKKLSTITKPFTKTEMVAEMVASTGIPKRDIVKLLEHLLDVIAVHVKNALSFSIPGLFKVYVVDKPATKARKGINPFTREPTVFKAKPARKVIKIKPLKRLKTVVETIRP